jgi:Protein of unknown function (DUF2510)
MTSVGPTAPAGWYHDPQVPGQLRYWDGAIWTAHTSPAAVPPPPMRTGAANWAQQLGARVSPLRAGEGVDAGVVRRLALYERLSGWAWLTLGIIQILTVLGIIAGAWNIFASISRMKVAPRIERREASVPAAFESLTGYVIIGVINLVLGGVLGIAFLALDLFIRDQILKHRDLFSASALTAGADPHGTAKTDSAPA